MKRFAIAMLLPLAACAADPKPDAPTDLTAEHARELAVSHAKKNALWDDKLTVGEALYFPEADSWIVSFSRQTLKLGEDGFSLVVTDTDPPRISLQKGL